MKVGGRSQSARPSAGWRCWRCSARSTGCGAPPPPAAARGAVRERPSYSHCLCLRLLIYLPFLAVSLLIQTVSLCVCVALPFLCISLPFAVILLPLRRRGRYLQPARTSRAPTDGGRAARTAQPRINPGRAEAAGSAGASVAGGGVGRRAFVPTITFGPGWSNHSQYHRADPPGSNSGRRSLRWSRRAQGLQSSHGTSVRQC